MILNVTLSTLSFWLIQRLQYQLPRRSQVHNKIMSFGTFSLRQSDIQFQPTGEEIRVLKDNWDELDPSGQKKVHGKQVIQFMKRAGLNNYDIKEIWKIVNADHDEYLDESKMLMTIRLMDYAQKGLPISKESLRSSPRGYSPNIKEAVPIPQRLPKNMMVPDKETINSFHNRWLTLEYRSSGLAKGSELKKRYLNRASKDELARIWVLCSRTLKGHLTKGQTLMFEHFLNLKRQNVTVNSMAQESQQLIEEIDSENLYKIKSYTLQLESQKENYEKGSSSNVDAEQIQKFIDSNNQQIEGLKFEISKMKAQQTSNMNRALETIQKLRKVIDMQNAQIKELKSTLDNRGELDNKRAEFVEVCEYMTLDNDYPSTKKRQTPLSTNTEMPSEKRIQQQARQSRKSSENVHAEQEPAESKYVMELREKTIRLILEKRPMMPDEMRLIQRRINQMSPESLQSYYNDLYQKYNADRSAPEVNVSLTSTQRLDVIKSVFGNISLDNSEHEL